MPELAQDFVCPHCQQLVNVENPVPEQMLVCPLCGNEFSLPDDTGVNDQSTPSDLSADAQLDASRINQLSQMRRAIYRARSYAIVAAGACTVATAQLGLMFIREVFATGWGIWPFAYILGVIVAVAGAWHFIGRAMELSRETHQMIVKSPKLEPDFSTLSDGSQQARNLEQIQ